MITITRSQAREVWRVVRSIAPARNSSWPVFFEAGPQGLAIRARAEHVAVQLAIDGQYEPASMVVPLAALKDCAGASDSLVEFDKAADGRVAVRWKARQERLRLYLPTESKPGEFPEAPQEIAQNAPGLLRALRDACETADDERTRYALNTVRLRSTDGQIAATDGRQMLLQTGYRFPWSDDVRIQVTRLFASGGLPGDLPVRIGRSEDWVTLIVGDWTVHLEIDKDGRFPEVENSLPDRAGAVASLAWTASDRQFLLDSLDKLPGQAEYRHVQIDLNGRAAINGSSTTAGSASLILSNSTCTGERIQVAANRSYLALAAKLGFSELHLFGQDAPVLCDDGRRQYVWMTLSADCVPSLGPDAVRIDSPKDEVASNPDTRSQTLAKQQHDNSSNSNGSNGTSAHDEAHTIDSLIQQADEVKSTLKDALGKTSELLAGLKRQRKQSRLVQSTLASLRQLETAEG